MAIFTASSISKSLSTTKELLPPSSKAKILSILPAKFACKILPTRVLPVKNMAFISGCLLSASELSTSPCTILMTPAGKPASIKSLTHSSLNLGQ